MAMQRKSSVMITVTTIPFWFDTIQIKRVLDDILMRHCIIIIIIIIIITLLGILFPILGVLFSTECRPPVCYLCEGFSLRRSGIPDNPERLLTCSPDDLRTKCVFT